MGKNTNLYEAKAVKNDEFYTDIFDIYKELYYYRNYHFVDKVVLCNCDDPNWSAFWEYFHTNFYRLRLKKLISTHYSENEPTYAMIYDGVGDNGDISVGTKIPLKGNGDFRSDECIEFLKEADIIVTNPPFSLFREFMAILMKYNKQFLIIGSKNVITYKDFFPLLKDNKVWMGYNNVHNFIQPDGTIKKFGNIGWYTNIETSKRYKLLNLTQKYYDKYKNPLPDVKERYPKYDNYDAINVNKLEDIPFDYEGEMGVPITFMNNYNPFQFEIIGISGNLAQPFRNEKGKLCSGRFYVNGKRLYDRIVIRKKKFI